MVQIGQKWWFFYFTFFFFPFCISSCFRDDKRYIIKVDDDEAMVSTPNVKSLALKKNERKMWVQIKATSDAIEINMDEDRPASFESKDLGSNFVFWICLQSSHKRNWHKNDKSQKLSNLQNFNFWTIKWTIL